MPRVHALLLASLLAFGFFCPPSSGWADDQSPLIFLHYWTGSLNGGISEMTDAYNTANPKFKVRATAFEHESFKVGIQVMLTAGSPPDIFSYWAGAKVQALVDNNQLSPLDAVWQAGNMDAIFPRSVSTACTYNGHKFAIPVTQHDIAFYYNKHIFAKLGIQPPTNWEEFINACDTLQQAGITPIALGTRERWPAQYWFDLLLLNTAGPELRQHLMNGKISYDDPAVKQVFTLWRALLEAHYFNPNPEMLGWADAAQLVHSGDAAMTLMGSWIIGMFDNQLAWKQGEDYDFFDFPNMDSNIPMTALGPIDVLVVAREGRSKDANAILPYFSNPGPQMAMSKGSGALAPNCTIPETFYTHLQQRILTKIRSVPNWAFPYDLATPPEIADEGLNAFKEFVKSPQKQTRILSRLSSKATVYFGND